MKKFILVLLAIVAIKYANAGEPNYSRAKIWFDGKSEVKLATLGLDLSEGEYRKGVWFISDLSDREISSVIIF